MQLLDSVTAQLLNYVAWQQMDNVATADAHILYSVATLFRHCIWTADGHIFDSVAGQEIDIVAYLHADGQCHWEADGHFFGQCS